MSEIQIRTRQEYKRNRKKWTIIQLVAIALLAAIALSSFLVYNMMNRTYYIEYTESSNIDYSVQYKDSEFFEEEWLAKEKEYISSLVSSIVSEFNYQLNMQTSSVGFEYKYKIDAVLEIADKDSGKAYYSTSENLLAPVTRSIQDTDCVKIDETVVIDYNKFNSIATEFVDVYGLSNSSSTLLVTLDVEVLSTSDKFEQSNENKYSTTLKIPMAKDTFGMETTQSVPAGENKVIAYAGAENQNCFFIIAIVSAILDFLLILTLVVFLQLTRNEDITYAAKIRKLLNSYGSYIQRINGEFDENGYQLVMIKSFTELLGIRDTILSPILMSENHDETMTRFLIPTNTKILYVFEVKVDNYNVLYGIDDCDEEAVILSDDVDIDEVTEALAQPDVVLANIEYEDNDDADFAVADNEPGVEVVGVVWPEKAHKNKVYRYDPNGEDLHEGDTVLVPTRDAAKDKDVIRKAAVAHGNHRVDPEHIKHPLKKIIGVIKRKTEAALTANVKDKE